MTKHDEDGIDYLSQQCWWSKTLMVGCSSMMGYSTILFCNVRIHCTASKFIKTLLFHFMEYKGNWPKNYDTSIIQRANTYYTKVFFTKCCKSMYCLLYKIEKNYCLGLLLSCVWVRLATLVIHKEKIQHIVSLPFAWWQWPLERGIVGSALRRWRWNQTLLPRHLQGKATEN